MNAHTIRILIVDDSPTARATLRLALMSERDFEIVGEAADGRAAVRLVREKAPDIVTMDVFLKTESGFDVARAIMASRATPIIAITAADHHDQTIVFQAMQAGVLDVVTKLPGGNHPDYELRRARLVRTLRTLSRVPVISRFGDGADQKVRARPQRREAALDESQPILVGANLSNRPDARPSRSVSGLLLVGASTGGPPRVAALLRALPKPFALPVVVVQHIATGFVKGFATWLADTTGHPTSIVSAPLQLDAGNIYIAEDEQHVIVDSDLRVSPSFAPAREFHRPSVDVLFESVAALPIAPNSIAILMTGMGKDGAKGLLALRKAGARTIAQTPASCSIPAMPASAIELGAAESILDPAAMPEAVLAHVPG